MAAAPRATGRVQTVNPFNSFFMGGFECSTHRLTSGRRLDLIAGTKHDEHALADYLLLRRHGIRTIRDGLRWHLIERSPGAYDWASFLPMLRAAREAGMQVVWDVCHYGWPDWLDIWSPEFVNRFGSFAGAMAQVVRDETDAVPLYCPVNEISFWSWAGGQVAYLNPHEADQGPLLKRQLVRAAIAAIEAVRRVDPRARIVHAEPVIHIAPRAHEPSDVKLVADYLEAQWEALDMIGGRLAPELGGRADYLDIIGLNYYPNNQWVHETGTIPLGSHDYRAFRQILAQAYERYNRPIVVAETGAEGSAAAAWLHYIAEEVAAVMKSGVPVEGICLYPVLDYPGWDDERACPVGLLTFADQAGKRMVNEPLAAELQRQTQILAPGKRDVGRRSVIGDARRRRRS
jgi:hypothetical protein